MSFTWRQAFLATIVMTGAVSAHSPGSEGVRSSSRSNKPRQLNLDSVLALAGAGGQGAGQANGAANGLNLRMSCPFLSIFCPT